ncbi:MAG: PEP-CTERM sorting domain-containing protein [Pirellulales bacterium]
MTTRQRFCGGMGKESSTVRWAAVLALAAVAIIAVLPAHAIIVYEDPGRLTTMPVLAGGVKPGWQYMGDTEGFGGIPIGPRAWVAASHTVGSGTTRFVYANAGLTSALTYYSTRAALSADLSVMVLDDGQPDFLAWAPVWSSTTNLLLGQELYMYGYGLLRGSAVTNDVPAPNTQKGWLWGDYDFVLSYGTNNLEGISNDGLGNYSFTMNFDQPTAENRLPGTEGIYSLFDSGGGVFSYNTAHARWELIGINSAVFEVSATPNGSPLGAALYDARGFYAGAAQITGTANFPLPSFATALPYHYDLLAPYIVEVPEPATWSLLGIAATLGLLAKLRPRRVSYKP